MKRGEKWRWYFGMYRA